MRVEIRLLGEFEVRVGGLPVPAEEWRRRNARLDPRPRGEPRRPTAVTCLLPCARWSTLAPHLMQRVYRTMITAAPDLASSLFTAAGQPLDAARCAGRPLRPKEPS